MTRLLVLVFAPLTLLLALFVLVDANPAPVLRALLLASTAGLAFVALVTDWHLDYAEAELERLQRQQDRDRMGRYNGPG